jgi:hypothetical protein
MPVSGKTVQMNLQENPALDYRISINYCIEEKPQSANCRVKQQMSQSPVCFADFRQPVPLMY